MSKKFVVSFFAGIATVTLAIRAQTPDPVIAGGQTAIATTAPAQVSPSAGSDSAQSTIKLLQEMKAANEQTLKKQQAALDALDALQKEAEQIKIFSRRS